MLAISDERMPVCVSDAEVRALLIGTGETLGIDAFGNTSPAFNLAPGAYWSRYWSCIQRSSGGMSTDGAIVGGARLEQTMQRRAHRGRCSGRDKTRMGPAKETQQCQREEEQEHEQKHMDVHEVFSLLEMRRWDRSLLRRENKGRREGKSSR